MLLAGSLLLVLVGLVRPAGAFLPAATLSSRKASPFSSAAKDTGSGTEEDPVVQLCNEAENGNPLPLARYYMKHIQPNVDVESITEAFAHDWYALQQAEADAETARATARAAASSEEGSPEEDDIGFADFLADLQGYKLMLDDPSLSKLAEEQLGMGTNFEYDDETKAQKETALQALRTESVEEEGEEDDQLATAATFEFADELEAQKEKIKQALKAATAKEQEGEEEEKEN